MTEVSSAASPSQGIGDPVAASQRVFRRVLQAMSRPGRVVDCGAETAPPAPLGAAAWAVLLTLADFEAPVWLGRAARSEGVEKTLKFHTGCAIVEDVAQASFAVFADPGNMPPLADLPMGTDVSPELGCTAIIEVTEIDPHDGFLIRGPGIDGTARFAAAGLDQGLWIERVELQRAFPRGVDLVLTCGPMLAALPRTTQLEL
jgi:alpha-D-ribose 1-methylphosphonate 5-triphosphate synthase subunit PhnH